MREIGDGAQPEPGEGLLGALADAPQRADRERVQELHDAVAGTTSSPSGLARAEASLATNLVEATPTEQVIRCSSATRARIGRADGGGLPSRRTEPATSRKASSRHSGSTSGVTGAKTSITPAETSA